MKNDGDGKEAEETGIGEDVSGDAIVWFGSDGHGGTGDGCPGDVSAGGKESAHKYGVHHHFPSSGKEEVHGIACRLECGESGTDRGSDQESAEYGGALHVLDEIVDDDGLAEFLDDADAEGAEEIEFLHTEDGEEEEGGDKGGTAADEEDAHDLVEADVAVGIDFEEKDHRGQGDSERTDDDESGKSIEIAEEGAAHPQERGGEEEHEENTAIEPGMGPVARHVLEMGRRHAGAADEDVFSIFLGMCLKDIGEEDLPVEIGWTVVAYIVIQFVDKRGFFIVGRSCMRRLASALVSAYVISAVGTIFLPVFDRAATVTTIFHKS